MNSHEADAQSLANDLHEWREKFASRLDSFEARLDENTKTTKRVEDNTTELVTILNSWKGAMKVLGWIGKLAKPLTAIGLAAGAWFSWKGRP